MVTVNTVRKIRLASRSYGRGSDNHRTPALYGVFRGDAKIGLILGRETGFMDKGEWEVCRMADGFPRTVRFFSTFKAAKAFAETWEG